MPKQQNLEVVAKLIINGEYMHESSMNESNMHESNWILSLDYKCKYYRWK